MSESDDALTPQQALDLLDLLAKGESIDEGIDVGLAMNLADIALQIEQTDRADMLITHAINLAKETGENDQLAWALLTKSRITGNADALTEAALLVQESEDDWLRSAYNNYCGIRALESGDMSGAKIAFSQSLAIKEMLEDKVGMSNTLYNLGEIARQEEDLEQAKEFHARCVDIQEEIEDRAGMVNGLSIMGHLEALGGNVEGAILHYDASLEIAEAEQDFEGTVVARWGLSEMSRALGDNDAELLHLSQVMTGFMQLGRPTPEPVKYRLNELADIIHGSD